MKNFVIPSIDLLDGKIVRLLNGDYNKSTIYEVKIDDLVEPNWLIKKTTILNDIDKEMKKRNSFQGCKL